MDPLAKGPANLLHLVGYTLCKMRLACIFEKALQTYGWTNGWMDCPTDQPTDGWIDGMTHPLIEIRQRI